MDQDTKGVLKSFTHPSNSLHSLSYSVFCGDVADMGTLLPKKDHSLLIADITYGFWLAGLVNDEEPFKYIQLEKMIKAFAQLTTAPLWHIIIFHSWDQSYSVPKALITTYHVVEGLTWYLSCLWLVIRVLTWIFYMYKTNSWTTFCPCLGWRPMLIEALLSVSWAIQNW